MPALSFGESDRLFSPIVIFPAPAMMRKIEVCPHIAPGF